MRNRLAWRRPVATWGFAVAMGLAGWLGVAQASAAKPYVVRLSLCDRRIGCQGGVSDPKQGYYLISTGDCDGASVDLILTPDLSRWGSFGPPPRGELPRLRTGAGVNIGDSVETLVDKLGAKPDHKFYGSDTYGALPGECTYVYERAVKMGRYEEYRAEYVLMDGKVLAIHYNLFDADDHC